MQPSLAIAATAAASQSANSLLSVISSIKLNSTPLNSTPFRLSVPIYACALASKSLLQTKMTNQYYANKNENGDAANHLICPPSRLVSSRPVSSQLSS